MIAETIGLAPLFLGLYLFGLGTIIGSFLNVVIYRFHTGKSLSGHSHCLSCGHQLRWYDLFPVFSYLFLNGRCRYCGCCFTPRYLFVELATGLLFVAAGIVAETVFSLVLLFAILSVLVVIFVYDLRHFIIPDKLTIILTGLTIAFLLSNSYQELHWVEFGFQIGAALLGSAFLLLLWLVSKGQWLGFGDVKLAFPLGLLVDAELVFSFIVWSFWIGATISLLLVGAAKFGGGKLHLPFLPTTLTIKSVVPFAPFLISACLLVYFTKSNVLTLFTTF